VSRSRRLHWRKGSARVLPSYREFRHACCLEQPDTEGDDAALKAAGLSRGSKAFKIIAFVVLVVTGYAPLFTSMA
jgi:hypothetical protein